MLMSAGHRGSDRMVVGFTLPMQSVPITTNVSLNPTIQHYVIKFVSYLQQVGGFLQVLCLSPFIYFRQAEKLL